VLPIPPALGRVSIHAAAVIKNPDDRHARETCCPVRAGDESRTAVTVRGSRLSPRTGKWSLRQRTLPVRLLAVWLLRVPARPRAAAVILKIRACRPFGECQSCPDGSGYRHPQQDIGGSWKDGPSSPCTRTRRGKIRPITHLGDTPRGANRLPSHRPRHDTPTCTVEGMSAGCCERLLYGAGWVR
jgi:hypothetical protein